MRRGDPASRDACIAGARRPAASGERFEDTDRATGTRLTEVAAARRVRQIGARSLAVALLAGNATTLTTSRSPAGRGRAGLDGYFVAPTLLTEVTPGMRVAREEIFGPVLSVLAVDDDDEALHTANDSPYGLIAAVWTSDVDRALWLARDLQCGQVYVNSYGAGGGVPPALRRLQALRVRPREGPRGDHGVHPGQDDRLRRPRSAGPDQRVTGDHDSSCWCG